MAPIACYMETLLPHGPVQTCSLGSLPCEQTDRQTIVTQNITFPQTARAGGNNDIRVQRPRVQAPHHRTDLVIATRLA